jgi:hypothetical protein
LGFVDVVLGLELGFACVSALDRKLVKFLDIVRHSCILEQIDATWVLNL